VRRVDPRDAPFRLGLAILRNLAEDLGCTGVVGGVAVSGRGPEQRAAAAARFVEGDCFASVCALAEADPDLWQNLLLRGQRRRHAPAAATGEPRA